MAGKTEEINIKVNSDIGEASKDAAGLASEFKVMGVSLNTVKASFAKIIPTAKAMFGTLKAGIASTGIGLLVIALGSVVTYLTDTKAGAELLERGLKTVGAAISVITDRVAKFGGAVIKFFKGDFKGAAEDAKASVTGIVAEIKEEVKATNLMVAANQKLRDAQRDLNVETAQSVADIEKLKLVAEDITKSYDEREKAAVKAFSKETELENKRIKLAEEAVRLKQQEVDMSESTAEDLDELAELEINLANVRQESAGRQISLQNFLNGLRETEKAEIQAAADKKKADEDAALQKKIDDAKKWEEERKKFEEEELAAAKKLADEKKAIFQAEENFKKASIAAGFGAAAAMAGENVALSKGVAAAQVIYNTQQGIMAAMGATSVADKLLPYPLRLANAIATGVMGAAALSKIMSTDPSGAAAGGGAATVSSGTPAPEMLSGAFTLGGGEAPEPMQAYVVSDDITNNQNKLAIIRRRATI